uniref:Tick transposon n=1 Tax=Haemonchus placei TaxID=6290 RepID=A0A0N4WN59_HAEPC
LRLSAISGAIALNRATLLASLPPLCSINIAKTFSLSSSRVNAVHKVLNGPLKKFSISLNGMSSEAASRTAKWRRSIVIEVFHKYVAFQRVTLAEFSRIVNTLQECFKEFH